MRYIYLLFVLCCFNCNNERILQLPEIENAKVAEVLDVSPAYIFYDESLPDSTLLNRKNLIITTNWLVNVDKRLTLRQAIPHIIFLQDKKRNAEMHKNEDAKNYFTCNDTSIGNLGFVEFTNVNFLNKDNVPSETKNLCILKINSMLQVDVSTSLATNFQFSKENFISALKIIKQEYNSSFQIVLGFSDSLSFQDYITIKNTLSSFEDIISTDEFIY